MSLKQSRVIQGDGEDEGDTHQSEDGSKGAEHSFGVGEDRLNDMTMFVVADGDDVDDGSEDVAIRLCLGTLDMELVCEGVEATDGGCVATGRLVLQLVNIQGELLARPLWFGAVGGRVG